MLNVVFFVLGFMRDIVSNANRLVLLESKAFYTCDDIDSIKGEWARFVMQFNKYDMYTCNVINDILY